jgi:hypothetical protein
VTAAPHPKAGELVAALFGLVSVIPGAPVQGVSFSGNGTYCLLACASDDAVRAAAAFFGLELEAVYFAGKRWLQAAGQVSHDGGIARTVAIHGPHVDVEAPPILDEERLADAVQAAHDAFTGGTSCE